MKKIIFILLIVILCFTGIAFCADKVVVIPLMGDATVTVMKTGQTISYATGDDGDLEKGATIPAPRFTDSGNGTITDNLTKLVWLKNADVAGTTRTWATALTDLAQLNTDGTINGNDCEDTSNRGAHQTDWRLPNCNELVSLTDLSNWNPALPTGHPFTNVQVNSYYWSGSTYASDIELAWFVYMSFGRVSYNGKTYSGCVWPVRAGNYSKSIPEVDTTAPIVTIISPTAGATYATESASQDIGGTSSDAAGVTQVSWSNSRGGSGTATGTTSWSIAGLSLAEGTNEIIITARDRAGNTSTDTLTIVYTIPVVIEGVVQDFEDGILWIAGENQDTTGNRRGWAFLSQGSGDAVSIDNIGANQSSKSLRITFSSSNSPQIYFRSDGKTTDMMPEAQGANRMSFYIRFPEGFPIQPNPFRYCTWQLGTYIHDPDDWYDTHAATSEQDHGIHHYYHRLSIEQAGNGWVKYIVNTHPDQANYSGITVPPDISHYYNSFGRFYFHFGPEAGGPEPSRPFTIWIDEIKFYHDNGSIGGQVHDGGVDDPGFDGEFFED